MEQTNKISDTILFLHQTLLSSTNSKWINDIKNKQYQFVLFYNQAESQLAQEINKFKPDGIDIAGKPARFAGIV